MSDETAAVLLERLAGAIKRLEDVTGLRLTGLEGKHDRLHAWTENHELRLQTLRSDVDRSSGRSWGRSAAWSTVVALVSVAIALGALLQSCAA